MPSKLTSSYLAFAWLKGKTTPIPKLKNIHFEHTQTVLPNWLHGRFDLKAFTVEISAWPEPAL